MSCGINCRLGSDPGLLWLWYRPAAIAPIRPLAWEPPYAAGVALEKANKQTNKQTNKGGWIVLDALGFKLQTKKNFPNSK